MREKILAPCFENSGLFFEEALENDVSDVGLEIYCVHDNIINHNNNKKALTFIKVWYLTAFLLIYLYNIFSILLIVS